MKLMTSLHSQSIHYTVIRDGDVSVQNEHPLTSVNAMNTIA